jgi:hypothetical protein
LTGKEGGGRLSVEGLKRESNVGLAPNVGLSLLSAALNRRRYKAVGGVASAVEIQDVIKVIRVYPGKSDYRNFKGVRGWSKPNVGLGRAPQTMGN